MLVFDDNFEKMPRKDVAEAVDDFEWAFDERGATLTGVVVRDFREARIPTEVDGRPVVAIGDGAFDYKPELETVVLSATLETLGARVFSRNGALTTVILPENSRLTTIGDEAFARCDRLQAFVLPATLRTLGVGAFDAFEAFELASENKAFRVVDGVLFSADGTTLLAYPPGKTTEIYRVPVETTTVRKGACSGAKMRRVEFPESLRTLGDYAFSSCSSLEAVEAPPGLKRIGDNAFYNCRALKEITILGSPKIGSSAFAWTGVKTVAFSEGLTRLGSYAFSNCWALELIVFPASLRKIGAGAFSSCKALAAIEFPPNSKLTTIEENAFEKCFALQAFETPSETRKVGDAAFSQCSSLESFKIPASLRSLGDDAFAGCASLWSVVLPEKPNKELAENDWFQTLREIAAGRVNRRDGDCLFTPDGETLTQFLAKDATRCKIPTGTKVIGVAAFLGCDALETVEFPDGLTQIDKRAFGFCKSLKTLTFPASLRTVGESAFCGCAALETVEFGPGATTLEKNSFGWGDSLKRVVFPTGEASFADERVFSRLSEGLLLPDGKRGIRAPRLYGPDDDLTFVAPDGSPVAEYAAKNGINRVAPECD